MKFGGTSVGNAERIRKTAEIIKSIELFDIPANFKDVPCPVEIC